MDRQPKEFLRIFLCDLWASDVRRPALLQGYGGA